MIFIGKKKFLKIFIKIYSVQTLVRMAEGGIRSFRPTLQPSFGEQSVHFVGPFVSVEDIHTAFGGRFKRSGDGLPDGCVAFDERCAFVCRARIKRDGPETKTFTIGRLRP